MNPNMDSQQLYDLLADVPDTREIVIRPRTRAAEADGLLDAWRAAREEANASLDAWRSSPGRVSFSVFRAAEDRADAAEDALAAR